MDVFDEIHQQHLMNERDEARAEVEMLRDALRRIASGSGALTSTEQRLADDLEHPVK
jgi:hypothetical protein